MIDFSQLDRTIHERGRLSILTLLAAREPWTFAELRTELDMSDGNLITHLRTLENAGYVASRKRESRRETLYELTREGRAAFRKYLDLLEEIVRTGRR